MRVILNGNEMADVLKVTIESGKVVIEQAGTVGFKVGNESEFTPHSSGTIITTVVDCVDYYNILSVSGYVSNKSAKSFMAEEYMEACEDGTIRQTVNKEDNSILNISDENLRQLADYIGKELERVSRLNRQ